MHYWAFVIVGPSVMLQVCFEKKDIIAFPMFNTTVGFHGSSYQQYDSKFP